MNFVQIITKCKLLGHNVYSYIAGQSGVSNLAVVSAKNWDNIKRYKKLLNSDSELISELIAVAQSFKFDLNDLANYLRKAFRHIGKAGISLYRCKRIVLQQVPIIKAFIEHWQKVNEQNKINTQKAIQKQKAATRANKTKAMNYANAQKNIDFLLCAINSAPENAKCAIQNSLKILKMEQKNGS